MTDKADLKVQGSIIKSGWLFNNPQAASQEQYAEKVRSSFLASDLYIKQLSKDPRNQKQASQYVDSYLNDPKMMSTIQIRPVPAPKERSIDPANSFEGLIKIRKNGLCGITLKKEKIDITVLWWLIRSLTGL
jgi:hypothetical protein